MGKGGGKGDCRQGIHQFLDPDLQIMDQFRGPSGICFWTHSIQNLFHGTWNIFHFLFSGRGGGGVNKKD